MIVVGFLVAVHLVTLHEEPQTLSCSYLGASLGVRLQLYREVFFTCSSVSAQGYLGQPELVYLSCFQVNQGILPPCIPWTQYQSSKDCNLLVQIGRCGINCNFGEPTNPFSISVFSHIFWHPWVGSKRSGRIPEVWFGSVELWQFMTVPYIASLMVQEGWRVPFPW